MLPLLAALAHAAPAAHAVHLARPIALGAAHGRGARRDARRGPRAPPRPRQSRRHPCTMHMRMHVHTHTHTHTHDAHDVRMHACTHAHVHTCTHALRARHAPPMLHARRRGAVALGPRALRRTAARAAPLLPCRLVHVRCCPRPAPRTAATLCIPAGCNPPCASRLQPCASRLQPRIPGACCPRCSRPRTWPSGRPRPTGRLGLG